MFKSEITGVVEADYPVGLNSSFRAGGKADILVCPGDIHDLVKAVNFAKTEALPLFVYGFGSNLLVRDGGFRGMVVNLCKGFDWIKIKDNADDNMIYCGAGASLASVVAFAASYGMGGLEFLAGIPGTVGGAVKMNAGAFGVEIRDVIEDVTFIHESTEVTTVNRSRLFFSYRSLDCNVGDIICGCTFRTEKTAIRDIKNLMKEYAVKRACAQPLGKLTAGSVFKNPRGNFAGRLIEEAGLKGVCIGGAKVSEKHANFIENTGNATAGDIISLVDLIKEKVFQHSGVMLQEEIVIIGDDVSEGRDESGRLL